MPEVSTEEQNIQLSTKQPLGTYSTTPSTEQDRPKNPIFERASHLGADATLKKTDQLIKPPQSSITGVLSPGETAFKLRATTLEKQVADLHAQVEELIKRIKEEQEAGKKAVLKATIESEGNAEKLQSLVRMQREELLNLKNSLEVEQKNSQGKDVRIHELELALTANDSLLTTMGNNPYFAQSSQGEDGATQRDQELSNAKEETEKLLEKTDKSMELLQELLAELEETTDCGAIKNEIDNIAASLSPEQVSEPPLEVVAPNSVGVTRSPTQEVTAKEPDDVDETLHEIEQVDKLTLPAQTAEAVNSTSVPEIATETKGQDVPSVTEDTDKKDKTSSVEAQLPEMNQMIIDPENASQEVEPLAQTVAPVPVEQTAPLDRLKPSSSLSREVITTLFAAAPIASPESYLVSPFGFLSKETAARDLSSFPEHLVQSLETKNPDNLIDKQLYDTYKDTPASDIYLSSGNFSGKIEERVKISSFIRSLLGFFLPNHISTLPDNEVKTILSTATVSTLWLTTCDLYAEEKRVSSSSLTSLIMEHLGLTAAAIEEKQATLREIVDTVYIKFLNKLLGKEDGVLDTDEIPVSPILEALRKAFEMDEKEFLQNKDHSYQFFMIALKNFLLRGREGYEIVKLFERSREETLIALTESDTQKAEILRLFEKADGEPVV